MITFLDRTDTVLSFPDESLRMSNGSALIICGGRRGGVTDAMCDAASRRLQASGWDAEVVHPLEMDVRHCTGCNGCVSGRCVIDDDMDGIYGSFSSCDLLILATPIRFSGPSSIIKAVLDRFQVLWHVPGMRRPAATAAMMCGGSPEPRFGFTASIFRVFSITAGTRWMGHAEVQDTDEKGDSEVESVVGPFIDGIVQTLNGTMASLNP